MNTVLFQWYFPSTSGDTGQTEKAAINEDVVRRMQESTVQWVAVSAWSSGTTVMVG